MRGLENKEGVLDHFQTHFWPMDASFSNKSTFSNDGGRIFPLENISPALLPWTQPSPSLGSCTLAGVWSLTSLGTGRLAPKQVVCTSVLVPEKKCPVLAAFGMLLANPEVSGQGGATSSAGAGTGRDPAWPSGWWWPCRSPDSPQAGEKIELGCM